MPLDECLQAARNQFEFSGPSRWNLVISHRRRIRLNKELNLLYKPPMAIFLRIRPHRGQLNAAQNMYVWPGIQLIGSTASDRKGIKNGVLYTVTALNEKEVVLDGNISVTLDQVRQLLRLSYAITYAACQGSEFEA